MSASERYASPTVGYIVQSLVDAARGAPSDKEVIAAVDLWTSRQTIKRQPATAAVPCSLSALFQEGQVNPASVAHLFGPRQDPKAPPRIREVIIAPEVHIAETVGGARSQREAQTILPLLVAAEVDEQGKLTPRKGAVPWVPRRFLEPHGMSGPAVGTLDDLESAIAGIDPDSITTWADVERACIHVYRSVIGADPRELQVPGYQRVDDLALLVAESDRLNISRSIRGVLEGLPIDAALPPLLQTYLHGDVAASPPLDLITQQHLAATHVGQMSDRYPLSPNQRQTLHHVLQMCARESGQILAVNGPPGTGKTTLLQSVVASLWVQRALERAAPPVIVATSTNNQAVTNILDSFGSASAMGERSVLERRWLDGLNSHGVFHAGSTRDPGQYQYVSGTKSNLPMGRLDDVERSRMEARFVGYARESLQQPVPHVRAALDAVHAELRRACATIAAAGGAMRMFRGVHGLSGPEHRASIVREHLQATCAEQEEVLRVFRAQRDKFAALVSRRALWLRWLTWLVWTVWPKAFKNTRAANRACSAFLTEQGAPHTDKACREAFASGEQVLRTTVEEAQRNLTESLRAEQVLRDMLDAEADVALDSLLATMESNLDRGSRHRAFWLATHYWEARWLLETAKAPDEAAPQEERLAMLAPCHVATCYSLPAAHRRLVTRGGQIDLLMVDEAGQVGPEVGAAAFALANNALVIGDTYQLEPVWGVEPALDRANLRRYGLDVEYAHRRGMSAATGSVMQVAQRACRYRQFPAPHPSGLFLTEHRRCRDPIIAYCNELTYGGVLEPLRGPHGAKLDLPAMALLPVVGKTKSDRGSRSNRVEAEAIARWVEQNLGAIVGAYGARDDDAVLSLIGIVTPFRAQSGAVAQALRARGLPPFTVGTVHSLQGAERAIVIFSPTYSASERPGRLFFDVGPNMLNVAVSRAKDHFIVIGDPGIICERNAWAPSSVLAKHLTHLREAPRPTLDGDVRV